MNKLATHKGRITMSFKAHERSKKFLDWHGSRLMRKGNEFLLHVTFRKTAAWSPETGNVALPPGKRAMFS